MAKTSPAPTRMSALPCVASQSKIARALQDIPNAIVTVNVQIDSRSPRFTEIGHVF
jgi:hypothetical protein